MTKEVLGTKKEVVWLGIVSFLTDVSSEMIFSVFSIFFTTILAASTFLLGIIEGLADFSASSLDYVAGFISDRYGRKKPIAILGYGFSTLAKGFLVVANSVALASVFRVVERLGKSLRGPPRDAWISSLTKKATKGYSFALHKTFDKAGAILGPLIAFLFFSYFAQTKESFFLLFKIAFIPAILSVIILFFIRDVREKPQKRENIFTTFRVLDKKFKRYLISAAIFSLAYFSFSFLLLKAYAIGFSVREVILLYALFNVSFVLFAIPLGKIGDRFGRSKLIVSEYIIYGIMALGFIFAHTKIIVGALFVLFGIFYAIDESQVKAYITDLEKKKKASAMGFYNFVVGLIYLPASAIAGYLWSLNSNYAFIFAALISFAALIVYLVMNRKISN